MLKGNSVLGMQVLSRQDGQKIGTVKDIVISKDHTHIVAFILDEGGLFAADTAVGMENVVSFGKDAIIITDSKAVARVDHFPAVKEIMEDRDGLVGKEVFTESGDRKGKVDDIYFDESNGNLVGLELEGKFSPKGSNSAVQLKPADIVSIGPDAVVINMASVPTLEAQAAGGPKPLDSAPATSPIPPSSDLNALPDTTTTGDATGEYARVAAPADATNDVMAGDVPTASTLQQGSSDATVQLPADADQREDS
jgi:uncharacterized protein YrrD